MKVVVVAKQVATLGDEVEFTPDGRDVDPDYLERDLNEWDVYATEEALQLVEASGDGEVVVVSAGPEEAEEAMRRCLAMGAHRGMRVELAPGTDPLGVASALAVAIEPEEPDLVLAGVQSSDSVQAATGTMLAELLAMARVAVVKHVELAPGATSAVVHRELEGGLLDVVEVELPALLTIQTGINTPRYATLRAIKQAREKPISVLEAPEGLASCSHVRRMFSPSRGEGAEMLGTDPAIVATRILELVRGRLS